MKIHKVTLRGVEKALSREKRPRVRKRILAVKKLLKGNPIKQVAAKINVPEPTVRKWLQMVRLKGYGAFVHEGRRSRNYEMPEAQIRTLRNAIAAALRGELRRLERRRLLAIDAMLTGKRAEDVSTELLLQPATVRGWMTIIERDGATALASKRPERQIKLPGTDSTQLRALASAQKKWRMRRRFLAVADIADGLSVAAVVQQRGASERAIAMWIERFKAKGVEGLNDEEFKPHFKLTARQMDELKRIIRARPECTYAMLCRIVRVRFGVRYLVPGMRRLVLQSLGFIRRNGKLMTA